MKPIGMMLKHVHILNAEKMNLLLKEIDLTSTQCFVLIYLLKNYCKQIEVNQKDIEKEFNISNPTVTGILNRLQNKGLINRVACEKDARRNNIVVTKEALALDERLKQYFKSNEDFMLEGISEAELIALRNVLNKIISNLGGNL